MLLSRMVFCLLLAIEAPCALAVTPDDWRADIEELVALVKTEHADPFTNTVRVTVGTLRRKLSENDEPQAIETVIGSGYRLLAPEEPTE